MTPNQRKAIFAKTASNQNTSISKLNDELTSAIDNRLANPTRFTSEFSRGELRAFQETQRRIKQFYL